MATTTSWIIRNKETKAVVFETFNKKQVDSLKSDTYESIPIKQYLYELFDTVNSEKAA